MGWIRDGDGFWVADEGNRVSDFANIIGADGEVIHVQNVGRILAHCAEMQKGRGWSNEGLLKRAASIPLVEFLKHPALGELRSNEDMARYVSKYLPQYATSHETRGNLCPNIVIK
jgi:hypothetical protein